MMKEYANLSESQIISVTREGITFLDNAKQRQFIDFASCFDTYATKLSGNRAANEVGQINYYGELLISGDEEIIFGNPYIMFHDDNGTIFEFTNQEDCQKFDESIQSLGWYLFDLSD